MLASSANDDAIEKVDIMPPVPNDAAQVQTEIHSLNPDSKFVDESRKKKSKKGADAISTESSKRKCVTSIKRSRSSCTEI